MSSLNISLPKALKQYIEKQVATGDWSTPSEFVRELIRRDKERRQSAAEPKAAARKRRGARRLGSATQAGLQVMEELMAARRAAGKKQS